MIYSSFKAVICNTTKLEKGELLSTVATFPLTPKRFRANLALIASAPEKDNWKIISVTAPCDSMSRDLSYVRDVNKLNYLASRFDNLSDSDKEKFLHIVEDCGCACGIDGYILLTYNLHCYDKDVEHDVWDVDAEPKVGCKRNLKTWINEFRKADDGVPEECVLI